MTHSTIPTTLKTVLLTVSLMAAIAVTHQDVSFGADGKESPLHLVSGTLLKLDLSNGRGLLRTDLGRPIYFDVPNAYLFENVIVGARIALRLDEDGRAIKVMDTSIPDVVLPPDKPLAASAKEESQEHPTER